MPPVPSSSETSQPPTPDSAPSQAQPPIITYPEFLLQQPARPAPLLTARHILTTLYITGTAAVTIYGASKYLVPPLIESLTEARHSFAEHAINNIEKLNSRLKEIVWHIPPSCRDKPGKDQGGAARKELGDSDGASSADSDPTELFHVDAGTQTSANLSRRSSISHSDPDEADEFPSVDRQGRKRISSDEVRLRKLHGHLAELKSTTDTAGDTNSNVVAGLQELTVYLEGLAQTSPYYGSSGFGYGRVMGTGRGVAGKGREGSEDAFAKVKSEIRGIKGVLLSARSFPAAVT